MRLDVFTLVPAAFDWARERRPLAAVLDGELELRIFNYRDSTPLTAGQVDDDPYGGGPGMVLRVDVVAAALDAVYGGVPIEVLESEGALKIEGDRALAERFVTLFPLPPKFDPAA